MPIVENDRLVAMPGARPLTTGHFPVQPFSGCANLMSDFSATVSGSINTATSRNDLGTTQRYFSGHDVFGHEPVIPLMRARRKSPVVTEIRAIVAARDAVFVVARTPHHGHDEICRA